MPAHSVHHFVPSFLLKEWHSGPDNKLSCFRWENSRFVHDRYTSKSVAQQHGLYSLNLPQIGDNNLLEREYFAEKVDSPAAVGHKLILTIGIQALTDDDRRSWARFLLAQVVRTPEKIAHVRMSGVGLVRDFLIPRAFEKRGLPPDKGKELYDALTEIAPEFHGDYSLSHLPQMIESQLNGGELLNTTWMLRTIKPPAKPFLVADRPIIYEGNIKAGFVIALPISPHVFFVASTAPNAEKLLNDGGDAIFSTKVNYSTVSLAERYVYARDEGPSKFVKRLLRTGLL